jgi:adenylosuccinate synthase
VATRHAAAVCGADAVVLTKLDVLTGIKTIRVATMYETSSGRTARFPASTRELQDARPVYQEFAGWTEDISACRKFGDMPEAARRYVEAVQEIMGVPVEIVTVGSSREAMILR